MEELLGAMAGALVPVAIQWSRYDDPTQRGVRGTKDDPSMICAICAMPSPSLKAGAAWCEAVYRS